MPKTTLGKWSVGLNVFFLTVVIFSIVLVKMLKILDFDNHWWDVTVAIIFSASIIALITGIIARSKKGDDSTAVFVSIILGSCVVLFIFLHSLFIND
ncbi:MAG: hypothetical protein A2846_00105 [Candidatus Doudnabacteria bacterium RIFCSPHIGHO2_01_FULL_49_9]|uniref:Uncharacterized protein n=1 Tax=Candidatus Doudnabacteria bacterium RIFCSPHIGHO2_01_FULL_49_9 TaxID=1817827 RepID=A0A1F5P1V9_9BACT|nr:MAG: hypothetical protein A2846_00105 [Candidatus Doudnabacteria bacterium RIFCSPHIGHO2_01_FULL_49_9]